MKRTVWVGFVPSEEQIGSFHVNTLLKAIVGLWVEVQLQKWDIISKELVKVAMENRNSPPGEYRVNQGLINVAGRFQR